MKGQIQVEFDERHALVSLQYKQLIDLPLHRLDLDVLNETYRERESLQDALTLCKFAGAR